MATSSSSSSSQPAEPVNLLARLTSSAPAEASSADSAAISLGIDPSSPDILKQLAITITKLKEGGPPPSPEDTKTLSAAMKSHMDYTANLSLLTQLNKSYTAKYGSASTGSTK